MKIFNSLHRTWRPKTLSGLFFFSKIKKFQKVSKLFTWPASSRCSIEKESSLMILETLIFRSIWAFAWIRPLDLFLVIWKQKKVVTGTVVCKIVHEFASVWCKTASGEVGVSLPWWCASLVLLAPGYWSLFLNLKNWLIMEKWPLVIFP